MLTTVYKDSPMELNANFDDRAAVHSEQEPWVASPMKGVDRRMLDRIGDEVARATILLCNTNFRKRRPN